MSKKRNKITGGLGEDLAVKHLEERGYEILERNWGSRFGEIDIIARDRETLVFVEVKTKVGDEFGRPEEMVNRWKLEQVKRMAMQYRSQLDGLRRIDVIAIMLGRDGGLQRLNHYENVIM